MRGMCRPHYRAFRRSPAFTYAERTPKEKPPCIEPDCDKPAHGLGRCQAHYMKHKRATEPAYAQRNRDDAKRWFEANGSKEYSRDYSIKRIYGLDADAVEAMWESQGRACAICRRLTDITDLNIDHDHACCETRGKKMTKTCGQCVRGLLCRSCNLMLGHAQDNLDVLASAIAYLTGDR